MSPRAADDSPGYHVRIRDLPATERPRERLWGQGAGALSTAELLAILLRVGTQGESALDVATRLLAKYGLDGLHRAVPEELADEHGLGPAAVSQIKAALELGRRYASLEPDDRPTILSPDDVLKLLGSEMAGLEQEELRVLVLNTRHHVVARPTLYRGSVNNAQVRHAEILREAVRRNAPALVVVHNHPSGDPTPSRDDITMTRNLIKAGETLDIDILDHVILGHNGRFVSLRGEGLLD